MTISLSLCCILNIPTYFQEIYEFPQNFRKIVKFPLIFVQFTLFGLISVFAPTYFDYDAFTHYACFTRTAGRQEVPECFSLGSGVSKMSAHPVVKCRLTLQ